MPGRFVDAGGVRTYVTEAGTGPTVVLLHGASIAVEAYGTFYRQIEALSASFHVVAFDQLGFGRTNMPPDGRYRDRLERVDHAAAVLDALGIRGASLVGHSEGAFIAARLAAVRPDLAGRLVLMASGATAPALGGALDDAWIAASHAAYDYRNFPDSADDHVAAARQRFPAMDARHAALLHAQYERALASGQAAMLRRQHRHGPTDYRAYVQLQERHLFPHLAAMRVPTLLIWAGADPTVPVERGLALMRLIPQADLYVVNGSSHALMQERPETVTRLLASFCGQP